jgi:hypothetical protein
MISPILEKKEALMNGLFYKDQKEARSPADDSPGRLIRIAGCPSFSGVPEIRPAGAPEF